VDAAVHGVQRCLSSSFTLRIALNSKVLEVLALYLGSIGLSTSEMPGCCVIRGVKKLRTQRSMRGFGSCHCSAGFGVRSAYCLQASLKGVQFCMEISDPLCHCRLSSTLESGVLREGCARLPD